MSKTGFFLLLVFVVCCSADGVRASLIHGYFSGSIDINGHLDELADGAPFAGRFVYDTDATVRHSWISGGETHADIYGAFVELSVAIVGITDIYTYFTDINSCHPATYLAYSSDGAGDYILDFDGTEGMIDFIGELDLYDPELILRFSDTTVTDATTPVIMPDADNLITGSSNYGSVLYMWVRDKQGVNPGSAQINGNITSLSLQSYPMPVPEPATFALVAGGVFCFTAYRKKRKTFSRS